MSILGSPLSWAAIIGLAAAQPALAAAPSIFSGHQAAPPAKAAGSLKILDTFMHNSDGASGISEPAGTFVQIDSQNVTCPASAGSCTIVVSADVEASGGANTSNEWAIPVIVDGSYVDSAPYEGELLADGNYSAGSELQSVSVAPGKHTVAVQIVSFYGATVGYYQIQYSVYKPWE
jgi:hypothetical protein